MAVTKYRGNCKSARNRSYNVINLDQLNNLPLVKYQAEVDNKGEADVLSVCPLQQRVGCMGALW